MSDIVLTMNESYKYILIYQFRSIVICLYDTRIAGREILSRLLVEYAGGGGGAGA